MIGGPRSIFASLRAARCVGRASRLCDRGELDQAHAAAQEGLSILRHRSVHRQSPAAASALASLTVMAEESASPGQGGAAVEDIVDSLRFLRSLTGSPEPELCQWIPFLEARLLAKTAGAA